MPSVEELVSDQSQHVRAALGTQISGLASNSWQGRVCRSIHLTKLAADPGQNYLASTPNVPTDA